LIPRSDTLSWYAWSEEVLLVRGFRLHVTVRSLYIMEYGAHIAVQSADGSALPFTETGYRSHFVRFADVAEFDTPHGFVDALFPDAPIQVDLF